MTTNELLTKIGTNRLAAVISSRIEDLIEEGECFGSKVFLCDLYERCALVSAADFQQFGEVLFELHKLNLLVLSRADMVEVLDASKVERSDWSIGNATFTFAKLSR